MPGRTILFLASLSMLPGVLRSAPFIRGDVNGSGRIEISDAVRTLRFLFDREQRTLPCHDAADADDDGMILIADAVFLLGSLFRNGRPPRRPFPDCGADWTPDALGCAEGGACDSVPSFYDEPLDHASIVFLISRAGSMVDSGEFQRARLEVECAVERFPVGVRFAIVFFDAGTRRFPAAPPPSLADDGAKAAAIDFVQGTPGGSGYCPRQGLAAALRFVDGSPAGRSLLVVLTDRPLSLAGLTLIEVDRDAEADAVMARLGWMPVPGCDAGEPRRR